MVRELLEVVEVVQGVPEKDIRFDVTEEERNRIKSVKNKFGMSYREFVLEATEFVEKRESQFRRSSRGEQRSGRR